MREPNDDVLIEAHTLGGSVKKFFFKLMFRVTTPQSEFKAKGVACSLNGKPPKSRAP